MTYETYTWMCYICAGLSIFMLIVSIVLFLKLRIKKVLGDLTGFTERKAIRSIREQNSLKEKSSHNIMEINQAQERITDKIAVSGNIPPSVSGLEINIGTKNLTGH